MRRVAFWLLLGLAFSIPWEYSLDLGPPLGNIARVLGLALLLTIVPALLQAGRIRNLSVLHWLTLSLYLWLAFSSFWSIDPQSTLAHLRGYLQEMMIVWFVWELIETPRQWRALLVCCVAGSCVLALLTIANFASAAAPEQVRFVAKGQDPNDVARFLDLGFPLGVLLLNAKSTWPVKMLAWAYMPMGLLGVLLTASRGGFIAAVVALSGCAIVLLRRNSRGTLAATLALPVLLAALWVAVPRGTIERLATIPQQLSGGDLNQRLSIWSAGWQAFAHAPLLGSGAGTFVSAAGVAPADTAHNTALGLAVEGGMVALMLAAAASFASAAAVLATRGSMRIALGTSLLVWLVTSLGATVLESRSTWLLLGLIAVAGRLAAADPIELARIFPEPSSLATAPVVSFP